MTSIAERHKYILECLNRNGFIKVNDIAKDLEVTPVTIRKDLKYLEEKKLLYRTHGSASPINPVTPEINVQEKEKLQTNEKKRIAITAAKLIEKNDSIIIASGSTVHMLAEQLTPIEHLIVVTASLKTAILLNAVLQSPAWPTSYPSNSNIRDKRVRICTSSSTTKILLIFLG